MLRTGFFIFSLFTIVALGGCASEETDSPALYLGMSRDRLKARFGEPTRVEQGKSGGEDWYYLFDSWKNPDVETSTDSDMETRSSSVSMKMSNRVQEQPVHLSLDGYVMAPLPDGKIVPTPKSSFEFPQVH